MIRYWIMLQQGDTIRLMHDFELAMYGTYAAIYKETLIYSLTKLS